MNRNSKYTKWFRSAWIPMKDIKQKPIMIINGLIYINTVIHPKVALRWFDMLEQKLREGKVESTYYNESDDRRRDQIIHNMFGIHGKKFYMEYKLIHAGRLVSHKIYEMKFPDYEYYRCILHRFIYEQSQENPKLNLLRSR